MQTIMLQYLAWGHSANWPPPSCDSSGSSDTTRTAPGCFPVCPWGCLDAARNLPYWIPPFSSNPESYSSGWIVYDLKIALPGDLGEQYHLEDDVDQRRRCCCCCFLLFGVWHQNENEIITKHFTGWEQQRSSRIGGGGGHPRLEDPNHSPLLHTGRFAPLNL